MPRTLARPHPRRPLPLTPNPPAAQKICLATRVETAEGLISRYTPLEFCRAGDAMARDIGNAAGVWLDRGAARCIVADCEEHHPDAARRKWTPRCPFPVEPGDVF